MKLYIDKIRIEKNMSVRELHKKSGVALSHIHNIEQGYKRPSLVVICKIAKALGVPPVELFSCDDN